MARKKQYNYFEKLNELAVLVKKAAICLEELVQNFSQENLDGYSQKIHDYEHQADAIVDEITNELYDSFITPIDREDILEVATHLDDVLDGINSLTYLFENLAISAMRLETDLFANYVRRACDGLEVAMKEFPKFKNSKKLKQMIKQVTETESEADRLFSRLKKQLFTDGTQVLEIIKWKDVYERFETTINDAEYVAELIGGVVIKNS